MAKDHLVAFVGIMFMILVLAIGFTVKAANYEECRKVFSSTYCLTQMVTK